MGQKDANQSDFGNEWHLKTKDTGHEHFILKGQEKTRELWETVNSQEEPRDMPTKHNMVPWMGSWNRKVTLGKN